MFSRINKYLSLIKFSHTIFAMPFALIGFFIPFVPLSKAIIKYSNPNERLPCFPKETGGRVISLGADAPVTITGLIIRLALVILSMVFARSAAMAFNRWLDAKYDALNPRTAIREIPKGIITSKNALLFVIINCVAFVVCTWFINLLCFYLSFVALFVILFYSYTKRFTPLCHLVLGVGLSLAPIGAYLAVTGVFNLLPILFSFTVLFWVSGFDIIYALQDEEFDKSHKLKSIPAALGKKNALRVSELLHVLCAACVIYAGYYGHFHWLYWIGVAVFAGLLIYQHTLVKPNDLSKVNMAFATTNGIASVIFCIFVLLDLFNK
jgi:4-hydroxybenzoate polyprenyltransferase